MNSSSNKDEDFFQKMKDLARKLAKIVATDDSKIKLLRKMSDEDFDYLLKLMAGEKTKNFLQEESRYAGYERLRIDIALMIFKYAELLNDDGRPNEEARHEFIVELSKKSKEEQLIILRRQNIADIEAIKEALKAEAIHYPEHAKNPIMIQLVENVESVWDEKIEKLGDELFPSQPDKPARTTSETRVDLETSTSSSSQAPKEVSKSDDSQAISETPTQVTKTSPKPEGFFRRVLNTITSTITSGFRAAFNYVANKFKRNELPAVISKSSLDPLLQEQIDMLKISPPMRGPSSHVTAQTVLKIQPTISSEPQVDKSVSKTPSEARPSSVASQQEQDKLSDDAGKTISAAQHRRGRQ